MSMNLSGFRLQNRMNQLPNIGLALRSPAENAAKLDAPGLRVLDQISGHLAGGGRTGAFDTRSGPTVNNVVQRLGAEIANVRASYGTPAQEAARTALADAVDGAARGANRLEARRPFGTGERQANAFDEVQRGAELYRSVGAVDKPVAATLMKDAMRELDAANAAPGVAGHVVDGSSAARARVIDEVDMAARMGDDFPMSGDREQWFAGQQLVADAARGL